MITADQAARVKVAAKLMEAREALASVRSSIIWKNAEHHNVDELCAKIDELFARIIPK